MKKKLAAVLLLLMLCLGILAAYRRHMLNIVIGGWTPQFGPEDALVPMLMAEETLWQLSGEWEGEPGREPDGTIREIIGNEIPAENGHANFGEAGMPYWNVPDGILVHTNGSYFLMSVLQE